MTNGFGAFEKFMDPLSILIYVLLAVTSLVGLTFIVERDHIQVHHLQLARRRRPLRIKKREPGKQTCRGENP